MLRSASSVGCVVALFCSIKRSVDDQGRLNAWISVKSFFAKRQPFGVVPIQVESRGGE